MQVCAALEHLSDFPDWAELEAIGTQRHGVGGKTIAKLRELWDTGRLGRVDEFSNNPEQVQPPPLPSMPAAAYPHRRVRSPRHEQRGLDGPR